MSALLLAAALLIPFGTSYAALRMVLSGRGVPAELERIGAAVAFGLGLTSVTFFLWRLSDLPLALYFPAESSVLIAALVATASFARTSGSAHVNRTSHAESTRTVWAAALITTALVAASVLFVIHRTAAVPQGEWDAWAIWNLRAAFLSTPSDHWRDGFTTALGWSHPDYPLLVGSSVARLWTVAGNHTIAAPVAFECAVLAATVLVLVGTLLRVSGYMGTLLGLALLLVPEYLIWATSQCADVPLAMFVLIAVALLSGPPANGRVGLAGAAAGLAAWTKNEGLIPALALPLAYVLSGMAARHSHPRRVLRDGAILLLGLAATLLVLALFSRTVSPPHDLLTGMAQTGPYAKVTDPHRHAAVAGHMASRLTQWGGWTPIAPAWIVLAWLAGALVRVRTWPPAPVTGGVVVIGMLVAFYFVYVLTPHDLEWHLQTSWPRLIAQMWPLLVWTAAAGAFRQERLAER